MREALRRALWILPTIVVVSILSFWAAARNAPPPQGEEGLPLLFNSRPIQVERLTWNAALAATGSGPEARHGAELLVHLGGAALPHILPRLDSLGPSERRRVALALMPVAKRMQIREADEVIDGEGAEQFWLGFWQDHFVDFKPAVTRRVTARFGAHATPLRKEELLRLDTFALDEVVAQMKATTDPTVARRLSAAASHIADKPWTIPQGATPLQARQIVDLWQSWWARHSSKYREQNGPERLLAPVLQTRYALWLLESLRSGLGPLASGADAFVTLRQLAVPTVLLFALGSLGGSLLGVFLVAVFRARSHPLWARAVSGAALTWLGVPSVAWIAVTREPGATEQWFPACLLVLLSGTAVAVLHGRTVALSDGREPKTIRFRRVFEHVRGGGRRPLRGVAANASTMLGVVFLVEFGFDLPGWGRQTVRAVMDRDVTWLVLVAVSTSILIGVVHVLVALFQTLWRPFRRSKAAHG